MTELLLAFILFLYVSNANNLRQATRFLKNMLEKYTRNIKQLNEKNKIVMFVFNSNYKVYVIFYRNLMTIFVPSCLFK